MASMSRQMAPGIIENIFMTDCIHSNIFREEQLRWTFKLYDASGDGVLEQPEVRLCHRVTLAWKIPLEIKDFPKIKKMAMSIICML